MGRTIKINVANGIKLTEGLGIKQTKPGIPGYAVKARYEDKISRKTKRPAKEQYVVDRTDPKQTKIIHHVKEFNGREWISVHDHEDVKPAKRKRKRK